MRLVDLALWTLLVDLTLLGSSLVAGGRLVADGLLPSKDVRHDDNTVQMIVNAGYPVEPHEVTTEDCYINQLYRIPGEGRVVFLQHGLIDSSDAWLIAGPDHGALAFRLAELGYDVWLGNYRGNHYSRRHCTLDPEKNEYWQFTWDEMGKYDLPAALNYVIEQTGGEEKIFYVGHSMGSTTYMLMNSLDPTWSDKVEVATFFAPIAYVEHMSSPLAYLAPFANSIEWIAEFIGWGEFTVTDWLMDLLGVFGCGWLPAACESIIFLATGYDEKQMNETMLPTIVQHYPAGTSTFTVLHYAQGVNSGEFMGFDWGNDEANIAHHGSATPPLYRLEDVTTPIALFWGDNDWLAQPEDLLKIIMKCQTVIVKNLEVEWDNWNHLDFLFAIDVDQYVNNPFIELIESYQSKSELNYNKCD